LGNRPEALEACDAALDIAQKSSFQNQIAKAQALRERLTAARPPEA
jgi:hypothetical protein